MWYHVVARLIKARTANKLHMLLAVPLSMPRILRQRQSPGGLVEDIIADKAGQSASED
jgi:hypothetical protein